MKKGLIFLIVGIFLGIGISSVILNKKIQNTETETSKNEVVGVNGKTYDMSNYKPKYSDSMILVYDLSLGEPNINYVHLAIDDDAIVNWGDGEEEIVSKKNTEGVIHLYNSAKYKDMVVVEIKGNFKKFNINEKLGGNLTFLESQKKLIWAYRFNNTLVDGSYLFGGAINLVEVPINPTNKFTNMKGMFAKAESFNRPITFNTSYVTDMSEMFSLAVSFNQRVDFDTSNVKNMSGMFFWATSFNQEIKFITGKVTDVNRMFMMAKKFNSSIHFTKTDKIENTSYMFSDAYSFNQPLRFNFKNVTDMTYMFQNAFSFNQNISVYFGNFLKRPYTYNIFENSGMSAINIQKFNDTLN